MKELIKAGRIAYGIMIIALAIQQIAYADFRPVILPSWPASATLAIAVYVVSAALILAALAIIFEKSAREVSLILGGGLLLLFFFVQVPYLIIVDPNYIHLGMWTNPLKELVLSGGAFAIAGSFPVDAKGEQEKSSIIWLLEKLIPYGKIFVGLIMVIYGVEHFLYVDFVALLVPNWIPGHIFWTYFAGVALIGSGLAIILNIKLRLSAILLALMIYHTAHTQRHCRPFWIQRE
jgi:uncharacterized membrane protein